MAKPSPQKRPRGRPRRGLQSEGHKPTLSDAMRRGLEVEYSKLTQALLHSVSWPSEASAIEVAEAADVSRQRVYKWRKNPEYLRGLMSLMGKEVADRISASEAQTETKTSTLLRTRHLTNMAVIFKKTWSGPIVSPFDDGKTYLDAQNYVDHVADQKDPVVWVPDRPKWRRPGDHPSLSEAFDKPLSYEFTAAQVLFLSIRHRKTTLTRLEWERSCGPEFFPAWASPFAP